MPYKPDNYPSVSPYLLVADADETLNFLQRIFDAEAARRIEDDDGTIVHLEARIEDSIVMMGEPGDPDAIESTMVHVYVEEVDAVFNRARESGSQVIQEPNQKEGEADRRAGVTGPSGHIWWIATQVE